MLKFDMVHRTLTSPGYGKQPPIVLSAPYTQMTPALPVLKDKLESVYLTDQCFYSVCPTVQWSESGCPAVGWLDSAYSTVWWLDSV